MKCLQYEKNVRIINSAANDPPGQLANNPLGALTGGGQNTPQGDVPLRNVADGLLGSKDSFKTLHDKTNTRHA